MNVSDSSYRPVPSRAARRGRTAGRLVGALVVATVLWLVGARIASALDLDNDPPVTTLVTNMLQSSGSSQTVRLSKDLPVLFQGFRTGPHPGGYELTSISMYVRRTHESRYMTINAGMYRDLPVARYKVAPLTRAGNLNDFAHNEWQAPPNTYLEPNTNYFFALNCDVGCANDNYAQFGTTYSYGEDAGRAEGWRIENYVGFRKVDIPNLFSDYNRVMRIRIKGRPSPDRAYRTRIVSSPRDGDRYRHGEHIDIALTFTTDVYVQLFGPESSIGIQVGEATDRDHARRATYLSGTGTNRLLYRYQVQIGDSDADGIGVDAGGANSGFEGRLPTTAPSNGLVTVNRYFPGIANAGRHKVDGSLHVTDVAITSRPAHGDGYRLGERIEVTLTFSTEALATGASSIAIRVGDASDNYRAARYLSGSGSNRLVYGYQVQFDDYDADGISVDSGGPHFGFGGPLPTTRPGLGSLPTARDYPAVADDASHRVDRSVSAAFEAGAYTVSEDGTAATVSGTLSADLDRDVTIPITAASGYGATPGDYSVSASEVVFARGETLQRFTVSAVDDDDDDDGERVTLAFGNLPPGVRAGSPAAATVTIADDDGPLAGQTVTITAGRDAYTVAMDDVVFELTLAEASDEALTVTVRLAQEQPFLSPADLVQRIELPARATAATLRFRPSSHNPGVLHGGTLTAAVIAGAGYHIGSPAAASVRMLAADPALIARLGQARYRFDEDATGAAASFEVILETHPGFPAPNLSHEVGVATGGGTALADDDFLPVTATVSFAPEDFAADDGRWIARTWIEVPLIDDEIDELEEQLTVTLARDAALSPLIEVRNPNRTGCEGPCRSTIAIADNDEVGVAFLDAAGAPLSELRLTVQEGEQVSYRIQLDRRPAHPVIVGREAGAGGETAFIWTERELDWEAGQAVAVTLVRTSGGAGIAVADAGAREADGAVLQFRVTLDRAASVPVTVEYATADGTATAGEDYTPASGTLHFAPGETEHTVTVAVLDDPHDEAEETLTLSLRNAQGARLEDGEAVGTIVNTDPLPGAWLARFGRTAAGHVMDAVAQRLHGSAGGAQATIAGHGLSPAPAAALAAGYRAGPEWADQPATTDFRDLLGNSSFHLQAGSPAAASANGGGRWTVWGRGAWSRFAGAGGGVTLDGDVVTGTVGADFEQGGLLGGLAFAYSSGGGSFSDAAGRSGTLASSVGGIHPYLRLAVHERLALWGVLGYGLFGELELAYEDHAVITTDLGMLMAAVGLDATLLTAVESGGLELTAKADGLLVRTRSAAAPGLAESAAEVSRWRLLLEASHRGLAVLGGVLAPTVEVGGRYDGGAAETGFGLLVGGGLSYTVPAWGLTLAARGNGLLLHESGGFSEWGAGGSLRFDPGAPGRGLALRVEPSWGSAGYDARHLWSLSDTARLQAGGAPEAAARVDAELSYGLDGPGGHGVATPYAGISQSITGDRTWRVGARYHLASAFDLSLAATRSERGALAPEYTVGLSGAIAW